MSQDDMESDVVLIWGMIGSNLREVLAPSTLFLANEKYRKKYNLILCNTFCNSNVPLGIPVLALFLNMRGGNVSTHKKTPPKRGLWLKNFLCEEEIIHYIFTITLDTS